MAIEYPEKKLASMEQRGSRVKPVLPGDLCVVCGGDCDGPGFSVNTLGVIFYAVRVNGRPYCSRTRCYYPMMREFSGG